MGQPCNLARPGRCFGLPPTPGHTTMPPPTDLRIRSCDQGDLAALLAINEAGTPGVSAETADSLAHLLTLGHALVAESQTGAPAGFINLVERGETRYTSPNLRWFEHWARQNDQDLVYVDRIAIAPDHRRSGLGVSLYKAAFLACAGRTSLGCEVNLIPDNPVSHAFHARLGFKRVGDQTFEPGRKQVAYYVRALDQRG